MSTTATPLAGFAGDISYLGHTPEIVIPQLYKLVTGHRQLRHLKQPVYCFWQLALWCLVDLYESLRPASKVVEVHFRAAEPYLEEMLAEEDQFFQALEIPAPSANDDTLVIEHANLADEFVCASCRVCLWNLVVEPTVSAATESHLCGPCALEKRLKKVTFRFRFGPPAKLHAQFQSLIQQKL